MQALVSFFFCAYFVCLATGDSAENCRPDEQFQRCGTYCEPTCEESNKPCIRMCNPDVCQCKWGDVRNKQGQCVHPDQCPEACKENEERKSCGSACEPSCEVPAPLICPAMCLMDACQCKAGFYRTQDGNCVALDECPAAATGISRPPCGINEEFRQCGTMCEPRCDQPDPQFCPMGCVLNVCQCKYGFVRKEPGVCIRPHECHVAYGRQCPQNEEYMQCGTACEPSCDNPRPAYCTYQCIVNVCQCKAGFLRNPSTKTCILQSQCPRRNYNDYLVNQPYRQGWWNGGWQG